MGRTGSGLEIRGDAIRLSFYFEGKRFRKTLTVGDQPMKPTQANLKHANRLAEEIKAKIKAGTFIMAEYFPDDGEAGPTTLTRQLEKWLGAQRVEKSTKAGYEAAANFWKQASYHETDMSLPMGPLPVRALKPSHILTALARRPELSGKTINNYVSVLRGTLHLAAKDRILQDNPAEEIPSAKWQKEPPDPFTSDERDKIIAEAQRRHPGQIANMVRFWMWTGLRTSELIGLRWLNVDLAKGQVVIKEAKVRRERKDTKTMVVRTVHLNSQALAAIRGQKEHTYVKGEEVFQDPRDEPGPWETEASFRKVYWTRLLKGLGIRYRRPYQCRHTYATAMLMAGMTPAFCAKQLGHDVKVFLDTYAKWMDGDANDRELAKLEESISPQESPKTRGSA